MNKNILLTIVALVLLSFNTSSYAFPKNSLIPGGLAIIDVAPINQSKPLVYYPAVAKKANRVTVIKSKTNWLAIVGIPLDAKTGKHSIEIIQTDNQIRTKSFRVKPYKYRTQRLTIKNKNKVNPNKKSYKRIIREIQLKNKLTKTYSPQIPSLNFILPVQGRNSGRYGLNRFINGQKRQPHSGMDIAAPRGRSVKAPSKGTVLYTGDLFFTGKVVYLDHGQGVISLYAHLNEINVKVGEQVKKGQRIGKVGSTGRATGPHLHWSIYLNTKSINPQLFLP